MTPSLTQIFRNFFYVWLKRVVKPNVLNYCETPVPKDDEIVVYDVIHGTDNRIKDSEFFQIEMIKALMNSAKLLREM
jgi:hypothetical protein